MRLDGIQRASEQKPAKILALRRRKSAANPPKKKIVYEAGRLLGTLEIASEAAQREFIRNLPAEMLADRDDIGPTSTFEIERRDARIEEIEYAKRQLEIRITGLEREIEELRGKLATGPAAICRSASFKQRSRNGRKRSRPNAASSPGWRMKTRVCERELPHRRTMISTSPHRCGGRRDDRVSGLSG